MSRQVVIKVVMLASLLVSSLVQAATPLGPGFTYQGFYEESDTPVTGTVRLRFSLWEAESDGAQIGASQLLNDIPVIEGAFTVILNASGEFGPSAFDGQERWLQIEACPSGTCESPTVLTPRQKLTPTPYALHSRSASWLGLVDIPDGFADGIDDIGDPLWDLDGMSLSYPYNVVVGATEGHHQLRVAGGSPWTLFGWTGSLELDNGGAIGWNKNIMDKSFGIGQSNEGLYFFRTSSHPVSPMTLPIMIC